MKFLILSIHNRIMLGPIKSAGPIGSAVLTFMEKQTTKFINRYPMSTLKIRRN